MRPAVDKSKPTRRAARRWPGSIRKQNPRRVPIRRSRHRRMIGEVGANPRGGYAIGCSRTPQHQPSSARDHQGRTAPHRTAGAQAECRRHGQAETIARRRRQDGARRTVYRSVLHTLCAERPAGLRLRTRRVDRPGGCRCEAGGSASCRKVGGEKGQLGRRRTFCGAQPIISRLTGSPTAPTLRL